MLVLHEIKLGDKLKVKDDALFYPIGHPEYGNPGPFGEMKCNYAGKVGKVIALSPVYEGDIGVEPDVEMAFDAIDHLLGGVVFMLEELELPYKCRKSTNVEPSS